MPSPGTMTRYDIVGVKEDVSNIISNISPSDTPFSSAIGSEGIDNTHFEWQEDSLMPVQDNAQVEAFTALQSTQQPTLLRTNTTQILSKTASASGTADRVKKYGRAKELSYQLGLRAVEIKKDLEYAYVGIGATQVAVSGSNTVARRMAGAQAQIDPSTTQAVNGPLTEAPLLAIAEAVYTAGAKPTMLMIKPHDATRMAAFKNSGRTTFVEDDKKKITNVVEVYESPFGTFRVTKNRILKATDALVLDTSMWKKCVLRNWSRETLAKTGDSTQIMLLGEFSLKHKNYKGSGLMTGLT